MNKIFFIYFSAILSGIASLIFETVWVRSFTLILGSTVKSSSIIFSSYIIGLALGAYTIGRISDRIKRSRIAYLTTEIIIGASGSLISLLVFYNKNSLVRYVGVSTSIIEILFEIISILLIVLVPAFFMGGTFPLLLKITSTDTDRDKIGNIYGANVFGASLGTLLCSFVFLPNIGVAKTILIAAMFNALAGFSVLFYKNTKKVSTNAGIEEQIYKNLKNYPELLLLAMAFFSGFIIFSLEITWIRFSKFFLGNRIFSFSILLSSLLIHLSIGSQLSSVILKKIKSRDFPWLPILLLVILVGLVLSSFLTQELIIYQSLIERYIPKVKLFLIIFKIIETLFVLAPLFIPLGILFPILLSSSVKTNQNGPRNAGIFYFVNTIGSVLGSLLTGYWGIRSFGTMGLLSNLLLLVVVIVILLFIHSYYTKKDIRKLVYIMTAVIVFSFFPTFMAPKLGFIKKGEKIVYHKEDEYGVFQVSKLRNGNLIVRNNKTELIYRLGPVITSYVQEMQAHLGLFYKPEAKTAIVLGSGYGITAGAFSLYPSLSRITAVEIVPEMIKTAKLYSPFNHDYFLDERIDIVQDDGRHFLAKSKDRYDIISINVSDPTVPGGSSLFHKDFYEIVKQHLEDDGIVIQHAFGNTTDIVINTLRDSFPYISFFKAYGNGYNIVASSSPLVLDAKKIDNLLKNERVSNALEKIGIISPIRPYHLAANESVKRKFEKSYSAALVATDDMPLLEFSFRGTADQVFFSNQ